MAKKQQKEEIIEDLPLTGQLGGAKAQEAAAAVSAGTPAADGAGAPSAGIGGTEVAPIVRTNMYETPDAPNFSNSTAPPQAQPINQQAPGMEAPVAAMPEADATGTVAAAGAAAGAGAPAETNGNVSSGGAAEGKVEGAPEGYNVSVEEHNKRMQDADYASLYAADPIAADQAWRTMSSENLDKTIANHAWAEESDEQRKKREKREHNARIIAGLGSMVGALGNLVTASTSRDGRAVQTPDLTTGVDKSVKEAYARRAEALKELSSARRRRSELLTAGYANAEKRRQADRAYKLQEGEMARKAAADAHKQRMDIANYNIKVQELAGKQEQQAAQRQLWGAQQQYYNARRTEITSGSKKDDTAFYIGEEKIFIPKNEYKAAMFSAYAKLPEELRQKAAEMIFQSLPAQEKQKVEAEVDTSNMTDEQKKVAEAKAFLEGAAAGRYVGLSAENMHAALEAVIGEDGAEEAAAVVRQAGGGTKKPSIYDLGGQQQGGQQGGFGSKKK